MIFILVPLFSSMVITNIFNYNNKFDIQNEKLKNSRVEPHLNNSWIVNPTFDGVGLPWESRIEVDSRDVSGNISQGHANYEVIGDSGQIQIDDPLNDIDWQDYNNPEFPISPDSNGSSSAGLYITSRDARDTPCEAVLFLVRLFLAQDRFVQARDALGSGCRTLTLAQVLKKRRFRPRRSAPAGCRGWRACAGSGPDAGRPRRRLRIR